MPNDKWVKGTVQLTMMPRFPDDPQVPNEVSCLRKGCWAIHKFHSSWFTITHIPSGFSLKTVKGQQIAKRLADELTDQRWNTDQGVMPHFAVLEESKPIIARYAEYF